MATGTINADRFETVVKPLYPSNKLFARVTRNYSNITIGPNGYTLIDTITGMASATGATYVSAYTFIEMCIQSFNTGNIYGLARGSDANKIYALGKPNSTVTFGVQYFFLNSEPDRA